MRRPRLASVAPWLAAFVVVLTSGTALAETRIALIIANSRYASTTVLSNPAADAHLVEAALKKTGFDKVTILEDLGRGAMNRALQDFGNEADHADVALLYYAGHGVEIDNINYLVPVDAVFAHDRDVDIEAVKLDTMLAVTENAKRLRMIVIDACRDNPFLEKMKRSMATPGAVSKGMAAVEPSKNSLVVYSAKAGTLASDGRVNSPFAQALARRIVEPGREISLLLRQVRDDVLGQTGGKQEPFTYGSLSSQEFYFIPPVVVAAAPLVPAIDIEAETWALCKTSLNRGPCDTYLASYASGRFAPLAQTRVADITHSAAAATAAATAASLAANVAAARAASIAATNAANLAATYAAALAASSPADVASAADGTAGIAARSTSLGAAGGNLSTAPSSAAILVASPVTTSVPIVTAPSLVTSAPIVAAPAAILNAPLVAASLVPPSVSIPVKSSPVLSPQVAAASSSPSTVSTAVKSAPTPSAPVAAASSTPPSASTPVKSSPPSSVPVVVASSRPAAAPIVLASLGPIVAPPYAGSGGPKAPAGFAMARVSDLGITVRYDSGGKGLLVESVERTALVAGKLFTGDLITRIGTAVPDAAQPPDTQLAADWKSDGRLKLLVKRGDAISVVIIRGNN